MILSTNSGIWCLQATTPFYPLMSEGYEEMAEENLRLAEEALPLALEIWESNTWEELNNGGSETGNYRSA